MIFVFTVVEVGHVAEQFAFIGDCMPSSEQFLSQIKTIKTPDLIDGYYRPMRHTVNNLITAQVEQPHASCILDGGKLLQLMVFREEYLQHTRPTESQIIKKPANLPA